MLKEESSDTYAIKRLDGLTILRFSNATEGAGGIEQYLEDTNRILLQRNRITIIQLYLPENSLAVNETVEKVGIGTLIKIPLITQKFGFEQSSHNFFNNILSNLKYKIKTIIRDIIIYNPLLSVFLKGFFAERKYSRLSREPLNAREKVLEVFSRHNVDLIVIHFAGGFGSAEIINEAQKNNIPYLILNHFENNVLKRISVREQAAGAAGVGGVSHKNVPKYIKSRYTALSEGINTEFFRKKDNARPLLHEFDLPVVMLPARIGPGKGHRDLICAAYRLKRKGLKFKVVFAGREEPPEFKEKLESLISHYKISDDVIFFGQLTHEELRDLYEVSKVVVLPTYSEGLGRVLIEAQAMEIPVVAYDVGGVSEALKNGETGYLIKKGNVRRLVTKIKEIFANDNKRIQMGMAGRRFVDRKFGLSAFAKRQEDWYLNAIYKSI